MTDAAGSGLNRAAVLLMCLGEEATARVFQELSDTEIHRLSTTMAGINHIPLRLKSEVLQLYQVAQQEVTGLFFKGNEFAKKSISASDSGQRGESLLNQHIMEIERKTFSSLAAMKPAMVADLLKKEHPQTIALILSTQDSEHSAEIVSQLPRDLQPEIVYRIATLEKVSLEVLAALECSLEQEIGETIVEKQKDFRGFDRAVDLLSNMKNEVNSAILERLADADDVLAEKIRRKMLTFEGLLDLDDRILQLVLREISNDSLVTALKNSSDRLKTKIFANMSTRAAEMIREDLAALGPVRLSEVEAMQQSIVRTAMRLKEQDALRADSGKKSEL